MSIDAGEVFVGTPDRLTGIETKDQKQTRERIQFIKERIAEKNERGALFEVDEDLTSKLAFLIKELHLEPSKSIYVPNPAGELATRAAFGPTTDIIIAEASDEDYPYKELDLGDLSLNYHDKDPNTFDPGEVDAAIMYSTNSFVDTPASHVKNGGYVICNNYSGSAEEMRKDEGYEFIGVTKSSDGVTRIDNKDLDDFFSPVTSDDEFEKSSHGASQYVTFDTAADIVEQVTGKRENIVDEYNKIIQHAIRQELETAKRGSDPNQLNSIITKIASASGFLRYTLPPSSIGAKDDETIFLRQLPPKKNAGNELFVFKKTDNKA